MNPEIEKLWLETGMTLGFPLQHGKNFRFLYFNVLGVETTTLEFDVNSSSTVAAQAGTGTKNLRDSDGNKLIIPENRDNLMFDMFRGLSPGNESLRLFDYYEGSIVHDVHDLVQPSNGGTIGTYHAGGFLRGSDSPWNDPTRRSRQFTTSEYEPSVSIWNNNASGGATITPFIKYYIAKYLVEPIKDPAEVNALNARKKRCTYFVVGAIEKPPMAKGHFVDYLKEVYGGA